MFDNLVRILDVVLLFLVVMNENEGASSDLFLLPYNDKETGGSGK